MKTRRLTQARLHEVLSYDAETGVFRNNFKRGRMADAGAIAGTKHSHGYIEIKIDGVLYKAHRLAWMYVHGEFPQFDIDHISGIRDDNRLGNLRSATRSENQCNQRQARRNNRVGLLGVSWHKLVKKYAATIKVAGKQTVIGWFEDAGEAHLAYLSAKRRMHSTCEI